MPQRLTFDNGSTITWGYRQDGLKYSSNERAKRLSVITTVNAAGDTITRTRVSYDSHTQRYIGDFVRIGNNRWRVYHESGHADILTSASGDSTVYRYYVRDYLGSTRAVLAEDGTLLQDANYYPGGLSFSQLNDTEETDRLHCGKEWVDMEGLGWYDNTARFHDAILCRFTTPDPLAEQYPDLSPYSHCANNPLTIIDPSGMDIWKIDERGEIVMREENTTTDKFIMVDADGNTRVDADGNELSISFDYGTIISQKSKKVSDPRNGEIYNADFYTVRGDKNGESLLKFFGDNVTQNSKVEFSLFQTGVTGDDGLNFISTSHFERSDVSIHDLWNGQLRHGYYIRTFTHTHPISSSPGKEDFNVAEIIQINAIKQGYAIPSFYIYHNRKFYQFYPQFK